MKLLAKQNLNYLHKLFFFFSLFFNMHVFKTLQILNYKFLSLSHTMNNYYKESLESKIKILTKRLKAKTSRQTPWSEGNHSSLET